MPQPVVTGNTSWPLIITTQAIPNFTFLGGIRWTLTAPGPLGLKVICDTPYTLFKYSLSFLSTY